MAAGGFVVWRVARVEKPVSIDTATNNADSEEIEDNKQNPKVDTKVVELDEPIELIKPEDVEKLPESTPATFKEYMKAKLSSGSAYSDENCIAIYEVSKVSFINVEGLLRGESIDPEISGCPGGGIQVWYLQNSQWDVLGFQQGPNCESLEGTTITSEFVETCFLDDTGTKVSNPNGSIEQYAS